MASTLVGALRVILGLDAAEYKSGLKEAETDTKQFGAGMAATTAAIGKAFGGLLTVTALTAAAHKVIEYGTNIRDLADKTGFSTDAIQEMAHVASQAGGSLEGFTNAAFKLGINLADGTAKVVGATEALGLSYAALRQMSPEEQFKTVAIALGNVENAQERNRLGVLLMGKGYKDVAGAITQGYAEIAAGAVKSSEDQINALDDAGDALDKMKSQVMGLAVIIGGSFAKSMSALGKALQQDFQFIKASTFDVLEDSLENWGVIFGHAADGPKVLGKAVKDLPAPIGAVALSMEDAEKAAASLDTQIKSSIETNKKAKESTDEFAKSLRALGGKDAAAGAEEVVKQLHALGGPMNVLPSQMAEMANKLREGAQAAILMGKTGLAEQYMLLAKTLDPMVQFQQRYNVTVGEYVTLAPEAASWTEEMVRQLHELGGTLTTIGPVLESKMILPWTKFKGQVKEGSKEVEDGINHVGEAFKNLGPTILQAVQGGGDALKSIGSSLGMALGKDLQESLGGFLKKNLGKTLGDAVGTLLPGIGALLGPALSALGAGFKKLFGIGATDEVKKFNAEIDKVRKGLLDTHGPLEVLEQKARAVGLSFAENWGQQGKAGLEAFNKLVDEFNRRWQELEAQRGKLNDDLRETQSELDGLIGKARDLGYEFDQSGKFIGVTFESVKATADEFGVSIDGLGSKFAQQNLDAQAKKVVDAFTLMSKAGGDTGGILVGLKDEIGALVGKAIAMGGTVPKQFEPWVKNLIETGQLLDENGQQITDITKIKFGDPVATEFEKISASLLEVVNKLNEIVAAIAAIPTNKTFTVQAQYVDPGPPPGFGGGGGGESGGEPQFDVGTMGRLGTWFGNFPKTGTSATLHGLEAVVTPSQAPAFAMDVLSGLGAGGGGGDAALLSEIQGLRRDLQTTIPAISETAARHGAQTAGRRR